jgi:formiminotetrahydrofolate cyclodeaminase
MHLRDRSVVSLVHTILEGNVAPEGGGAFIASAATLSLTGMAPHISLPLQLNHVVCSSR